MDKSAFLQLESDFAMGGEKDASAMFCSILFFSKEIF